MFRRICVWLLLASPLAFAANKETQELQRDVSQLQDQVRQLKESQDRQLAALTALVQQALDTAGKSNTGVAIIQNNLQQSLKDMEAKVGEPVAGLSSRMDGLQQDMRTVATAVSDLTALVNRMQVQLTDLSNQVKVLATPAPPPPGSSPAGGTLPPQAAAGDIPTIGAMDLYNNALRDYQGGKLDVAFDEFTHYLTWYGSTPYAPNAQFYIGMIYYSRKDYDNARKAFDLVLEKYPDNNNKMADAFLYKGRSLEALDRRTEASSEFQEVIKRFPKTEASDTACRELKNIGYNCGAPRVPAPKPAKRKK